MQPLCAKLISQFIPCNLWNWRLFCPLISINRLRNLEAKVFLYIKSLLFYDCKMILQAYCEYVLKTVSCILRPVFFIPKQRNRQCMRHAVVYVSGSGRPKWWRIQRLLCNINGCSVLSLAVFDLRVSHTMCNVCRVLRRDLSITRELRATKLAGE